MIAAEVTAIVTESASRFGDDAGERLADCSSGDHGHPPDERMHSSYPTTLNGDEVTIACGIAFQRKLVDRELSRTHRHQAVVGELELRSWTTKPFRPTTLNCPPSSTS